MDFTVEDIEFETVGGTDGMQTGGFELLGSDETLNVGPDTVVGPGTVSVWRFRDGNMHWRIERPNGSAEFSGSFEVAA